ncbi:hypothetical protein I79_005137 [Cricetulus griseus]|uniref:Uncharacterized protein n=1 Tax=Cricetulus griseus TaxID=10029 RepID=G3H4D6_CRIGR|nr:hypothetical protein I79_005137 [Cricetulus griseus]
MTTTQIRNLLAFSQVTLVSSVFPKMGENPTMPAEYRGLQYCHAGRCGLDRSCHALGPAVNC